MADAPATPKSDENPVNADVKVASDPQTVGAKPDMREVAPRTVTEGSRTDGKLVNAPSDYGYERKNTYQPPVQDAIVTGDLGTQVTKGTSRPRNTGN